MSTAEIPAKPYPLPDEYSAPFFEAAARGELALQRCDACGTFMWPVRPRCIKCFSDGLGWATASGEATLYSFTLIHRTLDPAFAGDVPYNLAIVDLAEGVRTFSNVVGVANDELRIGMPLRVIFETPTGGVAIPKFTTDGART